MPRSPLWLDWRNDTAYAYLNECDRPLIAWEWLRRDPAYRRAFADHEHEVAGRWGLHDLIDPGLVAGEASPMWRSSHMPSVLAAHAVSGGADADSFTLANISQTVTLIEVEQVQHVFIGDRRSMIRLDVTGAKLKAVPAKLHYHLSGFARLAAPLETLKRLTLLVRTGRLGAARSTPQQADRLLMTLRAHDGLQQEASQREIAEILIDRDAGAPHWRVQRPDVRSQVQRLVRAARTMADGGYKALLR